MIALLDLARAGDAQHDVVAPRDGDGPQNQPDRQRDEAPAEHSLPPRREDRPECDARRDQQDAHCRDHADAATAIRTDLLPHGSALRGPAARQNRTCGALRSAASAISKRSAGAKPPEIKLAGKTSRLLL